MTSSPSHPMLSDPSHDELAEQLFVRDLKIFVMTDVEPPQRAAAQKVGADLDLAGTNDPVGKLRAAMFQRPDFRTWVGFRRETQRLLWDVVDDSIAGQAEALTERAAPAEALGSVRLHKGFVAPDYLVDRDVHLMPGGYGADFGDGSLHQGALMDRGGAVYMLGRNGGMLNDVRGQTAMAHALTRFPDLDPMRMLDMGCGVGTSTVPAAQCFPDAEVHGIDVGADMLRYAHARAESMGATVHFSQQSSELTDFPSGYFDLVYSCVMLHETSQDAVAKIMAESRRLLRPGGVAIHLEVPLLMTIGSLWDELSAELEAEYNNEPYWRGALTADYATLLANAGFSDVEIGYQRAAWNARHADLHFGPDSEGVYRSWFVASGRA